MDMPDPVDVQRGRKQEIFISVSAVVEDEGDPEGFIPLEKKKNVVQEYNCFYLWIALLTIFSR